MRILSITGRGSSDDVGWAKRSVPTSDAVGTARKSAPLPTYAGTARSIQPIHSPRIAGKDHPALLLGEAWRDRHNRIVEIPVRIVGREQDAVEADPAHGVEHVAWILRLLHRLRRDVEMLADIFRRRTPQMRDLVAHLQPQFV